MFLKIIFLIFSFPFIILQRIIHLFFLTSNITKIDSNFFIGGVLFPFELDYIKKNKMNLWIDLTLEFPFEKINNKYCEKNKIEYLNLKTVDTKCVSIENLELAEKKVKKLLLLNPKAKILISCASGVGRSGMTLGFLLYKLKNEQIDKIFKRINVKRKITRPNKRQVNCLKKFIGKPENKEEKL